METRWRKATRKSIAAAALMLLTLGVFPNGKAVADVQQQRRLEGTITVTTNDYETFGSDQRCSHTVRMSIVVSPSTRGFRTTTTCGGEIRTELLHYYRTDARGVISVWGTVYFYEGDSVNTNDLDGTTTYSFQIQPGWRVTRNVHVWNVAENERRDWSTIRFDVANRAV
ncbi:MAG: hypothetical protein BUE48_009525 [Thermomonospora sp. CIF 1]|nr:MAG: hypothetical protein BUE48_009525 [Thermomonospora sp. CIF 1]